jgi:alpha-1,3-glucan synthase
MDSFTDSDGEVAQSFVQKLRDLSADNSKGDLCIEKFLIKSEKAFFDEIKKEKISAMSIRSSRDSFIQSRAPSMIDGFRPECEFYPSPVRVRLDDLTPDLSRDSAMIAPYSNSGHGHDDHMSGYGHGDNMYGDEAPGQDKPMTKLQIFLQRSIGGWPLYTIIISLGQLLSAVSTRWS